MTKKFSEPAMGWLSRDLRWRRQQFLEYRSSVAGALSFVSIAELRFKFLLLRKFPPRWTELVHGALWSATTGQWWPNHLDLQPTIEASLHDVQNVFFLVLIDFLFSMWTKARSFWKEHVYCLASHWVSRVPRLKERVVSRFLCFGVAFIGTFQKRLFKKVLGKRRRKLRFCA